jgi:hypothetical protein
MGSSSTQTAKLSMVLKISAFISILSVSGGGRTRQSRSKESVASAISVILLFKIGRECVMTLYVPPNNLTCIEKHDNVAALPNQARSCDPEC